MSTPAARSLLFVPGDRPERIDKARACAADAVVVDLEDAVAAERKSLAREALAATLSRQRPLLVRVNGPGTDALIADAEVCRRPGIAGVLLPKAEHPEDIDRMAELGIGAPVLPLIETARGFRNAEAIAAARGVSRLVFGTLDFQLDLGIGGDEADELLYFRSQLVLVSRLAGLVPPIDGVTPALDDDQRLRADIARARRLGFGGKLCIHPRQVAAVNEGFGVSAAEREWARRVLSAVAAAGGGAVAVDGRMVDAPVIERARRVLAQSESDRDR
jgi:citrate lyase subunit beta/citryl-CoA lyase